MLFLRDFHYNFDIPIRFSCLTKCFLFSYSEYSVFFVFFFSLFPITLFKNLFSFSSKSVINSISSSAVQCMLRLRLSIINTLLRSLSLYFPKVHQLEQGSFIWRSIHKFISLKMNFRRRQLLLSRNHDSTKQNQFFPLLTSIIQLLCYQSHLQAFYSHICSKTLNNGCQVRRKYE